MRTKIVIAAVIAGMLLLAGCATTTTPVGAKSWEEMTPGEKRVVKVNREARRRGIEVVWVNPPTRNERRQAAQQLDNG